MGSGIHEQILKDYNGQTYWLSTSTHHIFGNERLKWLALAGGYGATGMTGGSSNPLPNYYNREREFYFGLDVDLSQIPTQKKGIKVLLEILNCIKFPAPTLEFETDGTIQFHYLFL